MFCPLALPSALPCLLPSLHPIMRHAVLTAVRSVFLPLFHPYLALHRAPPCPLSCNHLDFYLPSALPSTYLCPSPVLILSSDLRPPSGASSNMSLLCHLSPLLLPSLSRYPSHLPLSLSCPPLRLTHASPSPGPSCLLSCPIMLSSALPVEIL